MPGERYRFTFKSGHIKSAYCAKILSLPSSSVCTYCMMRGGGEKKKKKKKNGEKPELQYREENVQNFPF
ncbi:hypothetical protein POVWA1_008390 [Plasmodium ovale wallikeri]|uniref:Uncharacterized protein n=1 Tax=Plasmodium ovale wallikeri TaxID=864142 RepID=A0A1A8YJH1_PLAOA|nr:hypothetical protein POVWA1_008390 [Plasmodium ovale wallikeri]